MELEQRITKLEQSQAITEAKRKLLLAEHLALRAAVIELATLISDASTDRFVAAKQRAMNSLTSELMAAQFSPEATEAATAALEELFSALAEAHAAADQAQPPVS